MRTAIRVAQLQIHPHLVASSPHAAFEDLADPELAADLLHVDRFTL